MSYRQNKCRTGGADMIISIGGIKTRRRHTMRSYRPAVLHIPTNLTSESRLTHNEGYMHF